MTPADFTLRDGTEIAATIGFGIARRALWSGERCTWFDAIPVLPTQNQATSAMAGPDVYGGTSGIGLFLAQVAARTGDALLRRTARAALRQAAAHAQDRVGMAPHGFYGGVAGVGAALVLGGSELQDAEVVAAGRALLLNVPTDPAIVDMNDVIGGLAGSVMALAVAASALNRDAALLARAGEFAERLIARGERDPRGTMSWHTMDDKRANLTGFGHGTAGIAHALLLLHALTAEPALREAAAAAFAYAAANFDSKEGNWPDYRVFPGQPPGPPGFMVAWCHGAPGIVRSQIFAETQRLFADAQGDFNSANAIEAGLGATARYAEKWFRAPNTDYTACHGMFGLADTLLDGVRSGRAAYAATLSAIVTYAIEHFHRGGRAWPSGLMSHEEIDGLMLGNAGIGHVFLRLGDPSLGSLLAPAPLHS
jgi:lantibiotic modifying enzyme